MQAIINTRDFLNALNSVKPIISTSAKAPSYLKHVYIEAQEEEMIISASAADIHIATRIECATETPGECALDFGTLQKAARAQKAETAILDAPAELDQQATYAGLAAVKFRQGLAEWHDRELLREAPQAYAEIDRARFQAILARAYECIHVDTCGDALENLCITADDENKKLYLESLNGHQLYTVALDDSGGLFTLFSMLGDRMVEEWNTQYNDERTYTRESQRVMLRRDKVHAALAWLKTLPKKEAALKVMTAFSTDKTTGAREPVLHIGTARSVFSVKLQGGASYPHTPDLRIRVIDSDAYGGQRTKGYVEFSRSALLDALETLKPFAEGNGNDRSAYFFMGDDRCAITVKENRTDLACLFSGEVARIAFPLVVLRDLVKSCEGETVRLSFTHNEGPCKIGLPGNDDEFFLLMPMKMKEPVEYEEYTEEERQAA